MKKQFLNSKSKIPLIEFRVPGIDKKFVALIDTGAELSMFDKSFIEENKIKVIQSEQKVSIVGIDGKKTLQSMPIGCTDIIIIDGTTKANLSVKLPISDFSPVSKHFKSYHNEDRNISLIIGSDLLKHINAEIKYNTQSIIFNEK